MKQVLIANILLNIFSLVLSFMPVIYTLNNQRYQQLLNQYLLGISISNILMTLGNLSNCTFRAVHISFEHISLTVLTVVVYVALAFVLYFFARYMEEYLQLPTQIRRWYLASIYLVCGIHSFLAILSPFTGALFVMTETGYQRGPLFVFSQIAPLYCYLLFTLIIIAYRKKLTRREVIFFLLCILVPVGMGVAQTFLRGIATANVGVSLALMFILVNILFEYEVRLKKQENELSQMNVDIMLSQIQPHFLYNALTTISHLCKHDPTDAQQAIQEFSSFLRGNMASLKNRTTVPFQQELNHVKNYLRLEQRRFQTRLRVAYDIQATDFFIPALSLQPLVENAVRHGILKKEEGGSITIRSWETSEAFGVAVEDNGVGFEKASHFIDAGGHAHIGIENARNRLISLAGGTLDIQSSDQGSKVTLIIPKK